MVGSTTPLGGRSESRAVCYGYVLCIMGLDWRCEFSTSEVYGRLLPGMNGRGKQKSMSRAVVLFR